jgi:hypothetical protein
MSAPSYLDHLSDADLAFLAEAAQAPRSTRAELRARPAEVSELLASPAVFEALFRAEPDRLLVRQSPFLAFACMVERAARDLRATASVAERVGAGRRVPVFDVADLREFVDAPPSRLFLAELLSSFTHVASGAVWVRQRHRWRRRRFSEVDLEQLARLLELVAPAERPGVRRRLGDLSLFLSGVFPDHCDGSLVAGPAVRRLLGPDDAASGTPGVIAQLERLGAGCYREASAAAVARSGALEILDDVADRFSSARRVLNFITDRYLFAERDRWFPPPA